MDCFVRNCRYCCFFLAEVNDVAKRYFPRRFHGHPIRFSHPLVGQSIALPLAHPLTFSILESPMNIKNNVVH